MCVFGGGASPPEGVQDRCVFRGAQDRVDSTCLPPPGAECLDLVAGGGGILLSPVFRRSRYTLNKLKGIYMQVGFGL